MSAKTVLVIVFGFTLGIFLHSVFIFLTYEVILCFCITAGIFLYYFLISRSKFVILSAVFLLFISLGILRFHWSFIADEKIKNSLDIYVGQNTEITGIVSSETYDTDFSEKILIEGKFPNGENAQILASVPLGGNVSYGDSVDISGVIAKPTNFQTDYGKDFDYISYLGKDDIFYTLPKASVRIISHHNGSVIKEKLYKFKQSFLNNVSRVLPGDTGQFMGGLILGARKTISKDLTNDFVRTGTIHMVAISGYNVTIVSNAIMKVLNLILPVTFSIGFGIFTIILFALMTGAGATVIRASIMAILSLFARATNRNYNIDRALLATLFLMLLQNPKILVFDVSFELSFLATIGIVYLAPKVKPWFYFIAEKMEMRDVISSTVATNIFVLPFLLYKMGVLSIVAIPANMLVLPLVPLTMGFGFVVGFLGYISQMFSILVAYIAYALLKYELFIIHLFSNLPFSAVAIKSFPFIIMVIIYSYYIWWIWGKKAKVKI